MFTNFKSSCFSFDWLYLFTFDKYAHRHLAIDAAVFTE